MFPVFFSTPAKSHSHNVFLGVPWENERRETGSETVAESGSLRRIPIPTDMKVDAAREVEEVQAEAEFGRIP